MREMETAARDANPKAAMKLHQTISIIKDEPYRCTHNVTRHFQPASIGGLPVRPSRGFGGFARGEMHNQNLSLGRLETWRKSRVSVPHQLAHFGRGQEESHD